MPARSSRAVHRPALTALTLLLLSSAGAAVAQSATPAPIAPARHFRPMPDLDGAAGGTGCPRGILPTRRGRDVSVRLDVAYADYTLYNPSTDREDPVHLRSYNGCPTGPVIRVDPGSKLRIDLRNRLRATDTTFKCPPDNTGHHRPHCFNTVNLHTHGLHVSPSGKADNVMLSIHPGQNFQYEYDIPANHPAGTHWYHAHRHGSTAIQVSSGGAGVIVVKGTRRIQDKLRNGGLADIDTLLHHADGRPWREQTMLFQQIEYGCFSSPTSVQPLFDPVTFEWTCASGQVGELRSYDTQLRFQPDPRAGRAGQFNSTWDISGRYTQINGVVQPVMPARGERIAAGEIQRWRLVHGGVRDSISLKIVKANLDALLPRDGQPLSEARLDRGTEQAVGRLRAARSKLAQATTLDALCSGEVVKQVEFALDGHTRTRLHEKAVNVMHPGQRSDVLVAFPDPGLYCVLDAEADAGATINLRPGAAKVKDRRLLSLARVGFGPGVPRTAPDGYGHDRYWQHVRQQLLAGNPDLPPRVRDQIAQGDIGEYAPIRQVPRPADTFVKPLDTYTIDFDPATAALTFGINHQVYDPGRMDFTTVLGRTDEWTIGAVAAHIFHIHVNPFQIVDIRNAAGRSIYRPDGSCTDEELASGDTQLCDQRGAIRDTVFVKDRYQVVLRLKNEDFTGQFVMHCHILDHEDEGMMMNVQIASPVRAALENLLQPLQTPAAGAGSMLARLGLVTPLRQIPGNDEICTTPREDRAVIGRLTEPPIPWKRTARPVVSAGAGWLTTLR